MGKVYLVGAGPGDAGLITVKGLKILKTCDAVVYDRLATEELLDAVRPGCRKIYVGKEAYKHCKKQEEINRILADCAKTYDTVVRLKGGDPFVFGRGGEEIEALMREGIPYEVIPGVSSAVAVPECAGIPVTHRGISRSVHVITGHTEASVGSPVYDYETLAKLEGTLVFLMGLSNLAEIAEHLLRAGKPAETPAAAISDGTLPAQRVVRGSLKNIAERVRTSGLTSPAVIVIGKTAEYSYLYGQDEHQAADLRETGACKRVGITATDLLWKRLKKGFEEIGMQPVSLCSMQVVPTEQMRELRQALLGLERYHWVMFTSQNAVQLFFEELKRAEVDIRVLGKLKFAVIGSGTAKKLQAYGIKADFVPSRYTVSALAEEFAGHVKQGQCVLMPRAAQGSPELVSVLNKYGISHKDIPIYDVKGRLTGNIKYLERMDYLVFVSASGVTAFFEELRSRKLSVPSGVKLACIGNITAERLIREYGGADVVAAVNDADGLIKAIKERR